MSQAWYGDFEAASSLYPGNCPGIDVSSQNRAGHRAGAVYVEAASDSFYKIKKALMINLEELLGPSETTGNLLQCYIL